VTELVTDRLELRRWREDDLNGTLHLIYGQSAS
jgi:hypothetical protein